MVLLLTSIFGVFSLKLAKYLTATTPRVTLCLNERYALMERVVVSNFLQRAWDGGSRAKALSMKIPPEQRPEQLYAQ